MRKSIHTHEHEKLTEWLISARRDSNLTMRQLAAILDVPHSFVGKVEQGERRLDVIEFLTYCDALGVSATAGLRVASESK